MKKLQNNNKNNREADVLQLFALVLEKVNLNLEELVPKILELVFSSTLTMITRDFQSYPDHRMNFFTFLRAVINYAFECKFYFLYFDFISMFYTIKNIIFYLIKYLFSIINK